MNQIASVLDSAYSLKVSSLQEAISALREQNIDPTPVLQQLQLDDFLDFLDEFFAVDNVFFQAEVVATLFWHLNNSYRLYLQACQEQNEQPSEITAEDFLSPDYAAIAQSASEVCLSQYLTDGASALLFENLLAYRETKMYGVSFWLKFAYNFILRCQRLGDQARIRELAALYQPLVLPIASSNHLQLAVALCSYNDEFDYLAAQIVETTRKSRDWLLSACAAVLQARVDGLPQKPVLAHKILGQGSKISAGIVRLVRELGYPEGESDCGPAVFSDFVIYCFQEAKVARVLCNSEALVAYLEEMACDGDQVKNELAKAIIRVILKKCEVFDMRTRLMKAMSGYSLYAPGPQVQAKG